MLTKTKNIGKNKKKKFFPKIQKKSEHIAPGTAQLKFERNLCVKFRDNCDTDGRTTDKLRFHELCRHSQAELKNYMGLIFLAQGFLLFQS